jgi:hypothetical protein
MKSVMAGTGASDGDHVDRRGEKKQPQAEGENDLRLKMAAPSKRPRATMIAGG